MTAFLDQIETFDLFAETELARAPMHTRGICQRPDCSVAFTPKRHWSKYCCDACREADSAEARKVGARAAPALLAWRRGKYEREDTGNQALRRLSAAGRRYVTELQTAWENDRKARREAALKRNAEAAETAA